MDKLHYFFGEGEHLNILQMSIKAFLMFFVTLVLIKIAGIRAFGKKSSFDNIIVIMLGALLARGIYAPEFLETIVASAVLVLIHRFLAWLCLKNKKFEKFIKGTEIVLYANDTINKKDLEKSLMSKSDLMSSLRLETKKESLENIETACMEANGRISFIEKTK
ncbi:MAG: DUF421 domain-containing protein [Chitinophagaceae bacterium]